MKESLISISAGLIAAIGLLGAITIATADEDGQAGHSHGPKSTGTPYGDPDNALPDSERRARNAEQIARQQQRNDEFVDAWNVSGRDARGLPRAAILAEAWYVPGSLADATHAADLVVVATVKAQRFERGGYSIATLEVEKVVKGGLPEMPLTVIQGGGPLEDSEGHPLLAEAEWDPILLSGDHVLVFLTADPDVGHHVVVPGQSFGLAGGVVNPLSALNPFGAEIRGRPLGEVEDDIKAAP